MAAAWLCTAAALAGCATTVDGTAVKAGAGPRNDTRPAVSGTCWKECDVLTTDILAETVGADPLDIQSTFVGAVCRWQAANPSGLVDITRFWYEQGSPRKTSARWRSSELSDRDPAIAGVPPIVMRTSDPNGACGVASDAGGVVGWWINRQALGIDAQSGALLMELTLATNS